jgi:hypothetical protein
MDEMHHFIEVAQGTAEALCTLKDGQEALKIILAAKRSASETGKVVLDSR